MAIQIEMGYRLHTDDGRTVVICEDLDLLKLIEIHYADQPSSTLSFTLVDAAGAQHI